MAPLSTCRNSARARTVPSTMTRIPPCDLAICRMIATVPTRWRSSGPGSSFSSFCSSSKTIRSAASARLTASIDIGRLTPSGATVIGKTTASRSGMTGIFVGSAGAVGASATIIGSYQLRRSAFAERRAVGAGRRKLRRDASRRAPTQPTADPEPRLNTHPGASST